MIVLHQVAKTYELRGRSVSALLPTDLEVRAGEVFGIIGRSGAGKSTLLRLINRLERPTGGRIVVDGIDCTRLEERALRELRRRVGMVFQHFNLLSAKTVFDNVALPARLAGESKVEVERRVHELLERVGLSAHAGKYPAQLSGGQKQRVGIARALATRPKILLCDEATSALDPETTVQTLELLSALNRELGLTIVLITHEMDVIRRVADRVAVMEGGSVVERGTALELFLAPRHPTTRRFIFEAEPAGEVGQDPAPFAQVPGSLLHLAFQGEATRRPLLAEASRASGVEFNILEGRIARLKDEPYGLLTLAARHGDRDVFVSTLREAGVHVEVLR